MMRIAGRPFIEYLIAQLRNAGLRDIVISTGHGADQVVAYFSAGDRFGVRIRYSHEREPLGTGGAAKLASHAIQSSDFLLMNGDSFFDIDLRRFVGMHDSRSVAITMALARVADASRYGTVAIDHRGTVTGFIEKSGQAVPALVNAGIYVCSRSAIAAISDGPVSLERETLPALVGKRLRGVVFDAYFVDIGLPEAYRELEQHPEPIRSVVA